MTERRKSIVCPYCNRIVQPASRQFHCSVWCRFWDKVEKLGPDDCWNWTAGKTSKGYGNFKYKKHSVLAHRFVWILMYGAISDNVCVLHRCDNPPCCNPRHLFLGTKGDNNRDCVKKNRHITMKGANHINAKLTENQVKEIRTDLSKGIVQSILATKYNVCQQTISGIKCERIYV